LYEIVHDGLRVRAGDQGVDASKLAEACFGRRPFPRNAADACAWAEGVADIESAGNLPNLD
jgi:hypothetical protein